MKDTTFRYHKHNSLANGCKICNAALSADDKGMLMFLGKYYVVYVTHPSNLYRGIIDVGENKYDLGRGLYNARQRKIHLAESLEGKSLCNMNVQMGDKKLDWDSPMQYVTEPQHGAGQTCKTCWQKAVGVLWQVDMNNKTEEG